VAGVEKPQLEVVLQHIVDRLPVDACGLHTHQRHLEGSQPIPEQQKPSSGGSELPDLLVKTLALVRDPHARSDRALVHVEPGASLDDPFHSVSLPFCRVPCPFSSPGGASSLKSLVYVL
jgi:hypothetical protein